MKKTLASVALSLALISSAAMAEERATDAALGALSGAVVLGPIGAVAGALVGYSAGPNIARAWGVRRTQRVHRTYRPRHATGAKTIASRHATSLPTSAPTRQAEQVTTPNQVATTPAVHAVAPRAEASSAPVPLQGSD